MTLSDLSVLKFDSYPKAIEWLNRNPGIAVRGESSHLGVTFTHMIFSNLLPETFVWSMLEHFPTAHRVNLKLFDDKVIPHPTYTLDLTRAAIVEQLWRLGFLIEKSSCCIESCSEEEGLEIIKEMMIRAGRDLSKLSSQELAQIYRSFNGL